MHAMTGVSDPDEFVREFRKVCDTPVTLLCHIAQAMAVEMEAGLQSPGHHRLKMLPTFLECLPSGNERGLYYAVDLGGTNFRVLRLQLDGKDGRISKQESEQVRIPQEVMTGTSKALFDFLADTISQFISKEAKLGFECHNLNHQRHIGFTFSFPVSQTDVNHGAIVSWTKGFHITDSVGDDVVEQLHKALAEMGSQDAKVVCLVNDTVGTLAQCRYWDEDAMVGVILGTGTNACYVERADAVPSWSPITNSDTTVINVEWGSFFSEYLPWTFADVGLDKDSLNPGQQVSEHFLFSFPFCCVCVRSVVVSVVVVVGIRENDRRYVHGRNCASRAVEDGSGDRSLWPGSTRKTHRAFLSPVTDTTLATRKVVYDVCDIIAERGARLSAAGIVGILKKINRCGDLMNSCLTDPEKLEVKKTVVAIDGSLYEKYTKFRNYMEDAMKEMLGDDYADNATTMLSKDGSGVGAALLAAAISTDLALGDVGVTR